MSVPRDIPPKLLVPHPDRLPPSRPDYALILAAHTDAVQRGEEMYRDPTTGLFVMTAVTLWERGWCCESGCRHCPYLPRP